MARMEGSAYMLLVEKPGGRKRRWEDNIKVDNKRMGV